MKHHLKTWPIFWEAIESGLKPFELRNEDDRKFEEGDTLVLNYYDPETQSFNGSWIEADVTYILRGPKFGLNAGWVIMGIKPTFVYRVTIIPNETPAQS